MSTHFTLLKAFHLARLQFARPHQLVLEGKTLTHSLTAPRGLEFASSQASLLQTSASLATSQTIDHAAKLESIDFLASPIGPQTNAAKECRKQMLEHRKCSSRAAAAGGQFFPANCLFSSPLYFASLVPRPSAQITYHTTDTHFAHFPPAFLSSISLSRSLWNFRARNRGHGWEAANFRIVHQPKHQPPAQLEPKQPLKAELSLSLFKQQQ